MLISVAQLPGVRAKLSTELAEGLETLNSREDHVITVTSLELEALYRMAGVVSFLGDGDTVGFHHSMFLAAAVRRRFLACVERGMKVAPGHLFATYDAAIYEALCAGEPRLTEDLARSQLTTAADLRFDNPYYYYFAHALRLLILRKTDPAAEFLATFDEHREGALDGCARLVHGILDQDATQFGEGLQMAVRERKEQIERDEDVSVGEQWLSVECLALARLGRSHGLATDLTDPLVPRELLGDPTGGYPDPGKVLPPVPEAFVEVPEEPVPEDE